MGDGERQSLLGDRHLPPQTERGMTCNNFAYEWNRVRSFDSLPLTFPVSALRLAQAGFLRKNDGTIICYFCELRRDRWTAGELPEEVHRQLRPDCPMISGRNTENRPVTVITGERLVELMRSWSLAGPGLASQLIATDAATLTPQAPLSANDHGSSAAQPNYPPEFAAAAVSTVLAAAGCSGGAIASGQSNARDSTSAQGRKPPRLGLMGGAPSDTNPGAGSIPQSSRSDGPVQVQLPTGTANSAPRESSRQTVTYDQLGIMTAVPKYSNMAMIDKRVGTYSQWPADHPITPQDLSEAGFVYAGYSDCGRCFFCGRGLKNWEQGDNPWVEHARWFPKCAYVKQCHGQDFIDIIQELGSAGDNPKITLDQVNAEMSRRRAACERIQGSVVDPAIASVLQVGFPQDTVNAVAKRLQMEGHILDAAMLVDSLLEQTEMTEICPPVDGDFMPPAELRETERLIQELKTENNGLRQKRTCKICLDKEVSVVFLPCGHLACCAECSLPMESCPVCRTAVKGRIRAHPN